MNVEGDLKRFAERMQRIGARKVELRRLGAKPAAVRRLERDLYAHAAEQRLYFEQHRPAVIDYVRSAGETNPERYVDHEIAILRRLADGRE